MRSSKNVTALLEQGYGSFLNLLYPRRCPLCHRILKDSHALICPECAGDLRPIQGARCYKCGKPVSEEEEYCRDCGAHPGAFDQGRGIFLYDDRMRYSIMKYKYFGCQEYSRLEQERTSWIWKIVYLRKRYACIMEAADNHSGSAS